MAWSERLGDRFAPIAGRLSDHLTTPQPAAVKQQRREFSPVVAAAVLVEPRGSPHFTGRDQQDLVGEPARFDVFDKRRHGMVEALQAKKRALQAEFTKRVTEIEREISELQALEFTPA